MKTYKSVQFYDAEKRFNTGNGNYCKTFKINDYDPGELEDLILELKYKQKEKNLNFKKNKKIKNPIRDPNSHADVSCINPEVSKNFNIKIDPGTGNTTILIGSSKKGKTTLIMYLYRKYYNSKKIISFLFAPHVHSKAYKSNNNLLKCSEFNKQCEKLIRLQKYINSKCENKYEFMNILDDTLNIRYNGLLNDMILTYRNSNISSIISLQYSNLFSKAIRSNANNIIFFGFNTDEAIEVVINSFLKSYFFRLGCKTMNENIELYKKMTKDHGFIYVHPSTDSISFHKMKL